MTNNEAIKKRDELLQLAQDSIKRGEFSETVLRQAELYMQLAELYKG